MNIDELKDAWNEDNSLEQTPEISIEHKNKINLPLEKVRKNMRMELWSTIAIFIFSFGLIAWCEAPFKFKFYITILIASMVFVTYFFFSKFFKLYKNISDPTLKTYESLQDLLHQFELNKQFYLAFYVAFVPFLVCELLIVLEFIPRIIPLTHLEIASILIGSLVIVTPLLFLVGKIWFRSFYGKHIRKIEDLVNELKR
ncbi:hypothetical protein [Chryseobacterium daeguense]|uniref:hypothetical protein n=1 Tax=Chryseobacterium daeguense TaxID=412438 RepID=UPI0004221396|nr:hypothetical protein [Chryseobacterium daeguense]